jgi:transposase
MGASIGSGPEIGPPMGAQLVAGATSPARAAQVIPVDHRRPFEAHLGNTVRARVEQTFGILARYRRLQVDHEGSTARSRLMSLLAAIFTTANRFERHIMA